MQALNKSVIYYFEGCKMGILYKKAQMIKTQCQYIAEKLFERNIFEKYVRIYLLKVNNKSSLKAQEKTFMEV